MLTHSDSLHFFCFLFICVLTLLKFKNTCHVCCKKCMISKVLLTLLCLNLSMFNFVSVLVSKCTVEFNISYNLCVRCLVRVYDTVKVFHEKWEWYVKPDVLWLKLRTFVFLKFYW